MASVGDVTSTSPAPFSHVVVAARRRRWSSPALLAGLGIAALVLGACGGDDDDAASTTSVASEAVTTTTRGVATPTTTPPVATTTTLAPIVYVTEGATVVVANASGINGAAGRLTDRLAAVGFTTAAATNSSDTVSNLSVSQIYHVADDADAKAVADSVKAALGGGAIEVLEVTTPAPTESGELGDASVLVLMGDDIADKPLDELQGRVAPATTAAPTDTTADDAGSDTTDDTSGG